MLKSTKISLKFSNKNKLLYIHQFINEYRDVVSQFVDILWEHEKVPRFLGRELISQVETSLSARAVNSAGRQAIGIVRGTRRKQEKRLFMINKFLSENKPRKAKKLQQIYDKTKVSKPNINLVNPDLDAKFVKISLENNTSFDGWITLASLGYKHKIIVPFKKTKHFNKMLTEGTINKGIRLSKDKVILMFELPKKEKKETGNVLGIDIGQTTVISCSDNYTSKKDNHGHDLTSITNKISRKQKGSLGFERASSHRKNYINWSINQLNLENIKQINIENIKNLRKNTRTSRKLSHWTYADIFGKLESYCEEQGVLVNRVSPTYTSQRCSECGWTRKSNRKGKLFKCGKCGFTFDADLNASRNLALEGLPAIRKPQRLKQPNRKGFYWNVLGQELRVPVVQRAIGSVLPKEEVSIK